MSSVGEMAKVFDKLAPYPNPKAWLTRMHARPAFQRSVEKGGVCEVGLVVPALSRNPYAAAEVIE
jgi:hypothetical protein